ncbi:unnamed protein product [Pocillopora meandrina]|uniref:Uncharacterized protein n=1 Tax=Pocillopora meandrina TaxID=46732 RepID=A0AAU9XWA3_9CNID|nr:unnamed protein product [Pocillopora meandrina]
MNYSIAFVVALMLCSLPGVRGITCKLCIPDEKTFKVCDKASEQVEVDCDVQPPPENLTQLWENRTYDACYTAQIEALAVGKTIKTFVFGCGVKVNSSSASVVNCSLTQQYVCADAKARAGQLAEIKSCSVECCDTEACNTHPTVTPSTTKATTTPTGGTDQARSSRFGFLLVFLVYLMESLFQSA